MKVLVLGGNRFFGRRLVEKLIKEKHDVTVINRGNIRNPDKARHIKLDRKDLSPNHPQIKNEQWDIIYDQVCYDAHEAKKSIETFQNKTKRYIFTSTMSVYDKGENLTENAFDPTTYDLKKNPLITYQQNTALYQTAKRQAEAMFFQQAPFPVIAVRFPFVLGKDDYTKRFQFHVERIKSQKPIYFPNIEARVSLIHAEDAAGFLLHLGQQENFQGPVNCCSKAAISLREMMGVIEGKLDRRGVFVGAAGAGETSPYGVEGSWTMDASLMLSLGFRPREIGEWLGEMVE